MRAVFTFGFNDLIPLHAESEMRNISVIYIELRLCRHLETSEPIDFTQNVVLYTFQWKHDTGRDSL